MKLKPYFFIFLSAFLFIFQISGNASEPAEERATAMLEAFAMNDGKIDRKEFTNAVEIFKRHYTGEITDTEIKSRLKKIMEENAWKAKEGGLFGEKWYSSIE